MQFSLDTSLDKQARLAQESRDFAAAVPWGELVLKQIRTSQFELSHAHLLHQDKLYRPDKRHYWALRVKVPQHLQDGFGTAPELLVVTIPGEVQSRDLAAAEREIRQDPEQRLDPDLVIVVSDWPELASRLELFPAARGRCVAWQVERGGPDGYHLTALPEALGAALATHDIFNERDPVRGRHVIGRRDEIRHLTQQVLMGRSTGLFGLRKVGKTTLIRKVTDELDSLSVNTPAGFSAPHVEEGSPRALVFFADAQDVVEHSLEALLSLLHRTIEERLARQGLAPSLPRKGDLSRFDRLLEQALAATPLPLCLVIDEYDYLFEPEPIPGLSKLLRLLRAKAQATRRLAIVVAGRDPTLLQAPKLDGVPHPMLGWFQDLWIGPFDKGSADEALRKLGRRVGLEVGSTTLSTAMEWTLGHPLLHRQFGSALWRILRRGNRTADKLPSDPHLKKAQHVFCELDAVRTICQEIRALLSEKYPESYSLLRYLTEGLAGDASDIFAMHGGYGAGPSRVLRHFGLLGGTEQSPVLPGILRWYLKSESA